MTNKGEPQRYADIRQRRLRRPRYSPAGATRSKFEPIVSLIISQHEKNFNIFAEKNGSLKTPLKKLRVAAKSPLKKLQVDAKTPFRKIHRSRKSSNADFVRIGALFLNMISNAPFCIFCAFSSRFGGVASETSFAH